MLTGNQPRVCCFVVDFWNFQKQQTKQQQSYPAFKSLRAGHFLKLWMFGFLKHS
jgi:hypothetical protein